MNKRQCVSCGAPIPLGALKCEYCGMTYEPDYWAGTVRYVPIRARTRRIAAKATLPRYVVDQSDDKELLGRYVKSDLSHAIAEALDDVMDVRVSMDPIHDEIVVQGSVWVEERWP